MARSGILHIGLPKTGTTSCQEALFANREMLLKRHGMFYPSVAPSHNSMLSVMFYDDPRTNITVRSKGITTREDAEALQRRYFAQIEADLASAPWDTLVLSSEGFSTVPMSSLKRLQTWLRNYADDWTVLLWSRHPVSYTTSNIQQQIKNGKILEELVSDPPMTQFKRRASDAFRVFGRENVRLTAFEEAREEPGGGRRRLLPQARAAGGDCDRGRRRRGTAQRVHVDACDPPAEQSQPPEAALPGWEA